MSGLCFAGRVPLMYTLAITSIITTPVCSGAVTVNVAGCHTAYVLSVQARLIFHLHGRVCPANLLH